MVRASKTRSWFKYYEPEQAFGLRSMKEILSVPLFFYLSILVEYVSLMERPYN